MKKNKNLKNFIWFSTILVLLSFLNLYCSTLIIEKLKNGFVFKTQFLNLTYASNTGAAFNILNNSNTFLANIAIITIFVIFLYLISNLENISKTFLLMLSMLTAGVYGNLYERLTYGFVRDFFSLNFIDFPIFNISDIYISVAVVGIIISIIFARKL